MFYSQTSSQRIGLVARLFFKCDEMRLSWVFYRQNTKVILRKISLNSCLKGLSQLYTERASGSSTGKVFFILSSLSYCLTWRSGNENGPEKKRSIVSQIPGGTYFCFSLLFFSFVFVCLFFLSPFCLLIYSFLVILVLFCSFIQAD